MTLVVDTSALIPALVDSGADGDVVRRMIAADDDLLAPALLDVEVVRTLRGLVLGRRLAVETAEHAVDRLRVLPIQRFDAVPLLSRIWALRSNLTAYDATYVALAETADAPLLTADARLAAASGPRCEFRVVAPQG